MDEGNENLVYPSPWHFKGYLTCRKILRHGTSGFISHPKEGELRIFIALKNPSFRPGSNPRPMGSVASTLTTTPPWRLQMVTGHFVAINAKHMFVFLFITSMDVFGKLSNRPQ
jgi:hypothetical protein